MHTLSIFYALLLAPITMMHSMAMPDGTQENVAEIAIYKDEST